MSERHRKIELRVKLALVTILVIMFGVLYVQSNKSVDVPNQAVVEENINENTTTNDEIVDEVKEYNVTMYLPSTIYVESGNEEEGRTLPYEMTLETSGSIEALVLDKLLEGVEDQKYITLYENLKVNNFEIKNSVAYVDFDSSSISPQGSLSESLLIESIVITLTAFDTIDSVQILLDGEIVDTFSGHVAIDKPLSRNYLESITR